jgi:hypothetical protein
MGLHYRRIVNLGMLPFENFTKPASKGPSTRGILPVSTLHRTEKEKNLRMARWLLLGMVASETPEVKDRDAAGNSPSPDNQDMDAP